MTETEQTQNKIIGGIRDRKAPRHWRGLQKGYSLRKKPKKILVLPGNGAETAKSANGMCKVVQDLLGKIPFKYEVCGFYYPDNDKSPQSTAERADILLNEYLVPLIADKNKFGDLERLSKEEACKNMRNVVVLTHCYGSRVMAAIDTKLDEIMADLGYSAQEAEDIHRQLFVAHHNNPRDDLGQNELRSSNLYRITQADERNIPAKYEMDSFPYYLVTEELQKDEILLTTVHQNEHALIIPRVGDGEESEHNGAYWMDTERKTKAGQREEEIFRAIFKEAVTSKYYIESLEQIENEAIPPHHPLNHLFGKIREYGQEFADEYNDYASDITSAFRQAKTKFKTGSLSAEEIESLPPEALFLTDSERKNLLDYAVEKQDIITAKLLWSNMRKEMPEPQAGNAISLLYDDEAANMLNAKIRQRIYLQRSLDKDDVPMFLALIEKSDLPYLDYAHAGEKLARRVGSIYGKLTPETANVDLKQFDKGLDSIHQRVKTLPADDESAEIKKALNERKLYSKQRYIQMLGMMREQTND